MLYNFNGKNLTIPDSELENSMKLLDITKEEAIQMWLDDNDYTTNDEVEELTEKAKKEIKRYEKSDKKRTNTPKTRKVDEEKKRFLNGFRIFVEGLGGCLTEMKNEAEFTFTFEDNCYTVKLIKHRTTKK